MWSNDYSREYILCGATNIAASVALYGAITSSTGKAIIDLSLYNHKI